jgi:hypothetical protein
MAKTQRAGATPAATVSVRVLPRGDGRIFTGDNASGVPAGETLFPTYGRGEVFAVDPAIATELERRGLVEIQP